MSLIFYKIVFFIAVGVIALPFSIAFAAQENTSPFGGVTAGASKQQQFPRTSLGAIKPISENEPVLLTALNMDYDQNKRIVIASGDVEVMQGETILLADQLIYNQSNNTIVAKGNVSVMEATGNVIFADEMELKNDMRSGLIKEFKARLSDDSLFVAAIGEKIDEFRTKLTKAVYSPCRVSCNADGEDHAPMWQISADEVVIDQEEQLVKYSNVDFELFGVPVFYSPYLSHATPGADNKSGFLSPQFKQNTNLGTVFKVPVYYVIGQDRDMTITPIYTGQEGMVMAGAYRQLFDNGEFALDSSITRPKNRDGLGIAKKGKEFRGHLFARGKFKANENVNWGFNLRRTTDDTYLRRYDFSPDTVLTSRAYVEGFNVIGDSERSYGIIQALSFQGLAAGDDTDRIPLVAPLMEFNYESNPGAHNSRFLFNANSMVLYRDIGPKSRRLSLTGGWKLPFITDDGQIIEFKTQLRSDIYSVDDVTLANNEIYNGITGRLVPEASLSWRYPLLNQWGDGNSMMIEPIVAMAVSPRGGNPEKIPNEDSLVPEFTDTNLFNANRFSGYDRIETGPRVSYGLRGQMQLFSDKYIDWLFGQHYRVETDRNFPFSNDLTDHFSDYVGKVGIHYLPFDVAYRFRLDKENLSTKRNEVNATFNYNPVVISGTYLSLQNDPILATKEEITGSASIALTKDWRWGIDSRMDLNINQITSVNTGFTFKNECTYFTTVVGRQYTRDRDIKPTTTFLFQFALKNLE